MKSFPPLSVAFFLLVSVGAEANVERLFLTAVNGDVYTLKRLLKSGADPNCYYTDSGDTPLHYAARAGQAEATAALLSASADPNARNNNIVVPLHYAIHAGSLETAVLLLTAGADPNLQDEDGYFPLQYVIEKGSIEAVSEAVAALLVAGANPNAQTEGKTPLHTAASNGHTQIVEALLAAGANPNAQTVYERRTPLHAAASNGHTKAVATLLAAGANPNVRNRRGLIPLDVALRTNAEVLSVLRAAGAKE